MYQLDSLSSTAASFDLPQNLSSGNYSINAYTLWMLNFPEFIYSKNIYVYGTDYKITTNSNKVPKLKIHFFPEGGDIIAGVKNRVAFKVTDDNGLPLAIKGNILHSNGTTITYLKRNMTEWVCLKQILKQGLTIQQILPTAMDLL
jgi:hypothetical protein